MKTLAVMCMAFTRQSPSRTPLARTAFSTSGVMFTKSMRAGTFIVRVERWCFMASLQGGAPLRGGPAPGQRFLHEVERGDRTLGPGDGGLGLPLDVFQRHHPETKAPMVMRPAGQFFLHAPDVPEPLLLLGQEAPHPGGGRVDRISVPEEELQEELVSGRRFAGRFEEPAAERVSAFRRDLVDEARRALGAARAVAPRPALSGKLAKGGVDLAVRLAPERGRVGLEFAANLVAR